MLKKSLKISIFAVSAFYVSKKLLNIYSLQKSNVIFTTSQFEAFKENKEKPILNRNFPQSNKEIVVVVGSGIIGLTTALYLVKSKKYQVILLEKEKEACNENGASFKNACSMVSHFCEPWITIYSLKDFFHGIFKNPYPLQFYKEMLFEKNILEFFFNALYASRESYFNKSVSKNLKLYFLTRDELRAFIAEEKIEKEKIEYTELENLFLFKEQRERPEAVIAAHERLFESKGIEKYKVFESLEEIIEAYPSFTILKNEKFKGFMLKSDNGIVVNTKKLGEEILKVCQKSSDFLYLPSTSLQNFIVNKDDFKVEGINSSKGIILASKFVLCTGISTKHILSNLGMSLPMVSAQGHSMTFKVPEGVPPLSFNLESQDEGIIASQIGNDYRLGGLVDFRGEDSTLIPQRVAELKKMGRYFGFNEMKDEAIFWSGLRPFTSDDVPVISALNISNVFVNTGHGGRGLTTSFGSAKVLYSLLRRKELENIRKEDYSLHRFWFV